LPIDVKEIEFVINKAALRKKSKIKMIGKKELVDVDEEAEDGSTSTTKEEKITTTKKIDVVIQNRKYKVTFDQTGR
jgi:hypothetical protein